MAHQKQEARDKAAPRRAYHKPELRRYGGIHDLTRGVAAISYKEAVYQQPEQMS